MNVRSNALMAGRERTKTVAKADADKERRTREENIVVILEIDWVWCKATMVGIKECVRVSKLKGELEDRTGDVRWKETSDGQKKSERGGVWLRGVNLAYPGNWTPCAANYV
jgi:hypothetical protein